MLPTFQERDTKIVARFANTESSARFCGRLLASLDRMGFAMRVDPDILLRHPVLAPNYLYVRLGDLEVKVETFGPNTEAVFYQNLVVESRLGGFYDIRKREKMPTFVGMQYDAVRTVLASMIAEQGGRLELDEKHKEAA